MRFFIIFLCFSLAACSRPENRIDYAKQYKCQDPSINQYIYGLQDNMDAESIAAGASIGMATGMAMSRR